MRLTATGKIMLKTMQELAKPLVLYFKDVENFDNQVREDFKFIENPFQFDKKTIEINTIETIIIYILFSAMDGFLHIRSQLHQSKRFTT